jgi:t-SNARE complex subunit (syntaxin)
VKAGIDSPAVRQRIELDEKSTVSMETSNPMAKGNAAFVASQQQQTARMIEQQDASLESLGKSVDGLGRMATEIREEVQEQNVLITKLGDEVDDAGNKMNVVTASLSRLLQTKDSCQIWTIVILTLILILLSKCQSAYFLLLPALSKY